MLRVGIIEYINSLPIRLPFQLSHIKSNVTFHYATPSQLNDLLQKRQLDMALTSSVEYLKGAYHILPGFGIAGCKSILSVNFYSQVSLCKLEGMRIGVTSQSATSVALLKILCQNLWKIKPIFEPLNPPFSQYGGFLLIGDEALRHLTFPHFQAIDLCQAWYQLTGLPFVFALFAYRQHTPKKKIEDFAKHLNQALNWSAAHRDLIEKEALKQCDLPPETIHRYFNLVQHRLGKKEMEGLECFKKMTIEHV